MPPQYKQINSIIEPDTIAFNFDAPGWTVVGISLLLLALLIVIHTLINYRKNKYRRLAIKNLVEIEAKEVYTLQQKAIAINTTIKQVTILIYNRDQVAYLDGMRWYIFLNKQVKKPAFSEDLFSVIQEGLYNKSVLETDHINLFINQSKYWIKKHVV